MRRLGDGDGRKLAEVLLDAVVQRHEDVCALGGTFDVHFRAGVHCAAWYGECRSCRHGALVAASHAEVFRVEGDVRLVAPDVLLEPGEIDEGIAVQLMFMYGVVAVYLFLRHGVVLRPFVEEVPRPRFEARIFVAAKCAAAPHVCRVLVTRRHVEIDACEVTLVHVVRLEDGSRVSGSAARSHFREPIVRQVRGARRFSIGIVASAIVDVAVCRYHVESVTAFRLFPVEPTLRHAMFAIVAVAFFFVAAMVSDVEARGVRVHVPNLSVGTNVAVFINVEEAVVSYLVVLVDNAEHRRFQLSSFLPLRSIVVVGGDLRPRRQACNCDEEQ